MARGRIGKFARLARSVQRLQRKQRRVLQTLNFRYNGGGTLSSQFNQWNLTNFSALTPVFGTAADDLTANAVRHVGVGVDCILDSNTEVDTINYTVYVVSLKDDAAGILDYSGGTLSLSQDVHYTFNAGMALLNRKFFKVHKTWRWTSGNLGAPKTQSSANGAQVWYRRKFFRLKIGTQVRNPAGNWNALACPRDPSQNYFLLMFNDNSALDLENPAFTFHAVHTMKSI